MRRSVCRKQLVMKKERLRSFFVYVRMANLKSLSLKQPSDYLIHKTGALVILNTLPARHIERYHSFAHGNDLAASLCLSINPEGFRIACVAKRKRFTAFNRTRTVEGNRIFLLCNLARFGMSTDCCIGAVRFEGDAERTYKVVSIHLIQCSPVIFFNHNKQRATFLYELTDRCAFISRIFGRRGMNKEHITFG